MPGGKAVTIAVYKGAGVHMWVGMKVCVHTHINNNIPVHLCGAYSMCGVDTWHFPWSAHFNDFIDMNLYLSIYHILQ